MGTLSLALLPLALAGLGARPERPNIVLILADDMGASELGCYGNQVNRTPHLDELARTGVQFQTAFTPPVCHPSRFLLLTGQYGCHNGVYNFPGRRGGPDVKNEGPDDITKHLTVAQLLRGAGYATALAGKWQLSGRQPDLIREAGFDEYCVWGLPDYYPPEDLERVRAAGIDFKSRYWHPSIVRDSRWVPTTPEDYGPDVFSDFTLDFIRRNAERPFFVYCPMVLTHGPHVTTPDSTKKLADRTRRSRKNYASNVAYLDQLVGRIVATLDELELRERTLVFFTADNGTHGEGKCEATELGARVPMIVNAPGIVRARGAVPQLTDLSDLFPTIAELAGSKPPGDRPIDGRSLAPFLLGESETTRDWVFAYVADYRILRTERFLLEENSPHQWGRLWDCGESRDGTGYVDVTGSAEPEVLGIKARFETLLAGLPAPRIARPGRPDELKDPTSRGVKRLERPADQDEAEQAGQDD